MDFKTQNVPTQQTGNVLFVKPIYVHAFLRRKLKCSV